MVTENLGRPATDAEVRAWLSGVVRDDKAATGRHHRKSSLALRLAAARAHKDFPLPDDGRQAADAAANARALIAECEEEGLDAEAE